MQSSCMAACRAVFANALKEKVLAHMVEMVDTGKCKQRLGRHGIEAKAGKQGMAMRMPTSRCSTNRLAYEAGQLLVWSVRFWRECVGAARSENGLGPTLLSPPPPPPPPHLSPLPIFVHTHSLNLQQENKI